MLVNLIGHYLTELLVSEEGDLIMVGPSGPIQTKYAWRKITKLRCSNNWLTSLPLLPKGLKELDCCNNRLETLPPLPEGLEGLQCSHNLLQTLPSLPKGLERLHCSGNQLRALPPLPKGLKLLVSPFNQLTSLPPLPEGLEGLYCSINLLRTLPPLPKGLKWLDCSVNPFNRGVDVELIPLRFRDSVPKDAYDLCVTLVTQRKEQFRKVLLALPGRPKGVLV